MSQGHQTIIIADDHPLFGVALRLGVQRVAPEATIVEVASFAELRETVQRTPQVSLVLLDLMMPDVEGLSALQYLREVAPSLRVAIVSGAPARLWVRAAEALGAVAFIPKSTRPEQTLQILQTLLDGGSWWPESENLAPGAPESPMASRIERLSRQELRILLQIKAGRLNKQIADDLGIAESTVKTHISTLLRKLDLQSRTQAAVLAQQLLAGE
ncbi:MAG TPA: response regulator transcription factor [Solimonas sp.]